MAQLSKLFPFTLPVTIVFLSSSVIAAPQYFSNKAGIVVKLAPSPVKDRFVAEISGTRSKLDENPLELTLNKSNPRSPLYQYKVLGKAKPVLSPADADGMDVFIPGTDAQRVFFNPKESGQVDVASISDRVYFRRKGPNGRDSETFKQATEDFAKRCGFKLVSIMKSPPKELLEIKDIGAYCANALSGATDLCDDNLGKAALKAGLKSFSCEPGAKSGVSFSSGKLTVGFGVNDASLAADVSALLEEKL